MAAPKPGCAASVGSRQQVARARAALAVRAHQRRGGSLVSSSQRVPAPDRERVEGADLRLQPPCARRRALRFASRSLRAGVDRRLVGDPGAIGAPDRAARGERRGRDAPRLAPARHVEHVDLAHLVVLALRREREPAAVGRPARLRSLRSSPPSAGAASRCRPTGTIQRSGDLLLLVVARLGDREDGTRRPSGETAGAPTRFIIQSASWVSGCLAVSAAWEVSTGSESETQVAAASRCRRVIAPRILAPAARGREPAGRQREAVTPRARA